MNRSVIFQPHLTSASTLSGKTQKLTNCIFIQMLNYFFARPQPVPIHTHAAAWLQIL